MKKIPTIFMLCLMASVLAVCAASTAETNTPAETPESLVVDLDLSKLSGTVVYAQVYNLMVDYESWLGKVIKMSGYYSAYEDTERSVVYHACVIPDATACCAQGIEFIWAEEHIWPDEYPEEGTDITVTGRLAIYEEDGTMYLHLVDTELEWENGV
jgi:hypothetical protein